MGMTLEASTQNSPNVIEGEQEAVMTSYAGERNFQNMFKIEVCPRNERDFRDRI